MSEKGFHSFLFLHASLMFFIVSIFGELHGNQCGSIWPTTQNLYPVFQHHRRVYCSSPGSLTGHQTLFSSKRQVSEQPKAESLRIGAVDGSAGVFKHVLVQRTVLGPRQQEVGVVLVPPHDSCGHVFVLLEGGEGDERPADVPHVDVVVHHHGAGGQVISALWTPLHPGHRRYGLNAVDLLHAVGRHVPDFHHLVTSACGEPPPTRQRQALYTKQSQRDLGKIQVDEKTFTN